MEVSDAMYKKNANGRDVVSYGLLIDRSELTALRVLAARRSMSVAQLFRETLRPLVDEAYRQFGKALPPRSEVI